MLADLPGLGSLLEGILTGIRGFVDESTAAQNGVTPPMPDAEPWPLRCFAGRRASLPSFDLESLGIEVFTVVILQVGQTVLLALTQRPTLFQRQIPEALLLTSHSIFMIPAEPGSPRHRPSIQCTFRHGLPDIDEGVSGEMP